MSIKLDKLKNYIKLCKIIYNDLLLLSLQAREAWPFKRYFPCFVKLFCLYPYNAYLIFSSKSEKHVTEGNKDWTFEVYLLIGEPISRFRLFEWLKMTCARSYVLFLNFLSHGRGFYCFCGQMSCTYPVQWLKLAQSQQNKFSILKFAKLAK